MTRGTVIGFLAIAALVGFSATLNDQMLSAIGGHLMALEGSIDANATYTHLPQVGAAASGVLADASYGDAYGPPAGDSSDVTDWYNRNFGVQGAASYPVSDTLVNTDGGSWNAAPSAASTQGYSTNYNAGGSDLYNTGNAGLSTNNVGADLGAQSAGGTAVYYGTAAPSYDSTDTYTTYTSGGYSTGSYGTGYSTGGYGYAPSVALSYGGSGYANTWYTQAFPGIGSTIIPLLPPVFQPGYSAATPAYSLPGTGYVVLGNAYSPPTAGSSYGTMTYSSFSPTLAPITAGTSYDLGTYAPSNSVDALASASQPTCSLSLSPSTIAAGGSTLVSWTSYNASSANLQGRSMPTAGSYVLSGLTASQTIGLLVSGAGGNGACYATLSVSGQSGAPLSCQIYAQPTQLLRGHTASLSWNAQNASNASLSTVGPVPIRGGTTVAPSQNTTYVLNVSGTGGSASCATSIAVQ